MDGLMYQRIHGWINRRKEERMGLFGWPLWPSAWNSVTHSRFYIVLVIIILLFLAKALNSLDLCYSLASILLTHSPGWLTKPPSLQCIIQGENNHRVMLIVDTRIPWFQGPGKIFLISEILVYVSNQFLFHSLHPTARFSPVPDSPVCPQLPLPLTIPYFLALL